MKKIALVSFLLAACNAPEPTPTAFGPVLEVAAADALTPPMMNQLAAAVLQAEVIAPGYRTFPGPTSCFPAGGINPFLATMQAGPAVGEPFTMVFWTRAMPRTDDFNMAWIFVGFEPATPVDFTSAGMPGCYLLVNPAFAIACPVGIDDGMVTRRAESAGRVALRWTPAPGDMGRRVWMQFVCAAPGENAAGLLASHAVELQVGDANWRNAPLPQ